MKLNKRTLLKELYLLILGVLGFSRMGQFLLLDGLGLPLSLMEVFYIPLVVVYRREILRFFKRTLTRATPGQVALLGLLACSFLVGAAHTFGVSFLLEYRSMLYMLVIFWMVYHSRRTIPVMVIQRVALYTVVSELLYIVVFSTEAINSSINCVAIAAAILAAFLCEKYVLGMVSFALGAFLGIVSGFRIGIVIAAAALVEAAVFSMIRRDKKGQFKVTLARWGIVFAFVAAAVIFLNFYEPIIFAVARLTGMDDFAVFRVTERLRGLLEFDMAASQDDLRMEIFKYPFDRFFASLLPRGLIGSVIGEYWLYIDVPVLYLYDMFGSAAAWALLGWFAVKVLRRMELMVRRPPEGLEHSPDAFQLMCLLLSPIMLVLLIINGSFMVITFQAVHNAVLLGGLCRKKNPRPTLTERSCPHG